MTLRLNGRLRRLESRPMRRETYLRALSRIDAHAHAALADAGVLQPLSPSEAAALRPLRAPDVADRDPAPCGDPETDRLMLAALSLLTEGDAGILGLHFAKGYLLRALRAGFGRPDSQARLLAAYSRYAGRPVRTLAEASALADAVDARIDDELIPRARAVLAGGGALADRARIPDWVWE